MPYDLVIQGGTVVFPEQGTFEADIAANEGTISSISTPNSLSGEREVDATGKYVFPGAIDPHTHHGIAKNRSFVDDAKSESRADLAGGVTTIGNMLMPSIQGDSWQETVPGVINRAEEAYYHDFYTVLAPLSEIHVSEIPYAIDELNVTNFKWFSHLKQSHHFYDDVADKMIQTLASHDAPTTLGFHAENVEITSAKREATREEGMTGYGALVDGFPGYAEAQSLASGSALAKQHDYDDSFYTVHISARETANELAALRRAGHETMGETCPHYLTLTTAESDDRMKVNPPVRSQADQDVLWERLADGTISCIGTDHICRQPDIKFGDDIWESENGFPGSELMLPLLHSEGVDEGKISIERLVEVTSTNTAKAWNLYPKKGIIRVGSDADLIVFDPDETRDVTPDALYSEGGYSVYEDKSVTGWPTHTVVGGEVAFENGEITGEEGMGSHVDLPL